MMFSSLKKSFSGCFTVSKPAQEHDPLMWHRDLKKHSHGEYSFAVVQGSRNLEDHSQVVTGAKSTFFGIYDGHAGENVAIYLANHLVNNILRLARQERTISERIITDGIQATEASYIDVVRENFVNDPLIATVGSCCLVGVIFNKMLYVANVGDSRAVLGRLVRTKIASDRLTNDHNANLQAERYQLMLAHPNEPRIVVFNYDAWRVKGVIEVTRSIGDAYLKYPEFALGPEYGRFYFPEPLIGPALRADPEVTIRELDKNDRFVIFASDGLWELMGDNEAVEFVYNNERNGIAKRLLDTALAKAAALHPISVGEMRRLGDGQRRLLHDGYYSCCLIHRQGNGRGGGVRTRICR